MPARAEKEKLRNQTSTCLWGAVQGGDNYSPECNEYILYKQTYRHCPSCGGRIIIGKPQKSTNSDKEPGRAPTLEDFNQKIHGLVRELHCRGVEPRYLFVGERTWYEMMQAFLDAGGALYRRGGIADNQWAGLDVHIVRTDHLLVVH